MWRGLRTSPSGSQSVTTNVGISKSGRTFTIFRTQGIDVIDGHPLDSGGFTIEIWVLQQLIDFTDMAVTHGGIVAQSGKFTMSGAACALNIYNT